MALPDVIITTTSGGIGRTAPSEDGVSALVTQAVAVSGTFVLGTNYELRSIKDAEALGITAAYDTANGGRLWFHLSEFWRQSPGATLFLRGVARTVTLTQMCDKTLSHVKALLQSKAGKIKQIAVCLNPDSATYSPTVTGGVDADVLTAVVKAQALAAEEYAQHRPVIVLLSAHALVSATAAPDARALASKYVCLVAGTDHGNAPKVPAIGTALGTVSRAQVHENIGWVVKFNLTGNGFFASAGLPFGSGGTVIGDVSDTDQDTLNTKGYWFARQHAGIDGFYWNDDHTATLITDDYAQAANVRTVNKATRVLRPALLPILMGPLYLNGDGTLRATTVGDLEARGKTALDTNLTANGEVSATGTYCDPTQDVQTTSEVSVDFELVQVATARIIRGSVGFVRALSTT